MAVYLYNGVPMKQFPEWDTAKCPYAYLANANLFDFDHYILRVMDRPGYIYTSNEQDILGSEGPPYLAEWIIPKAEATTTGEWTVYTAETQIDVESSLPNVFWTNTDINKDDGSLWLAASEPVLAESSNPVAQFDLKSWLRGFVFGLSGPRPFMVEPKAHPTLAPSYTWYKGNTDSKTITEINIVDSYTPTGTETENWAADVDNTGSIMCYIDGATLTMAGNGSGKIMANEDSSYLFGKSTEGNTGGSTFWKRTTHINGLTLLDTSNVTNMSHMFFACSELASLDLSNFDTSNVTDMSYMINANVLKSLDVSNFNTRSVTNMSHMFGGCYALTSLDLSNFNTSKVTDMSFMFYVCKALKTLNISSFDTSKVTNMRSMFDSAAVTSLNLSNFNTSNVTDMRSMFNCEALETLNVSSFDTSNVTNMASMFKFCRALISLDVSNFDTSNVVTMNCMFGNCDTITQLDLHNFNTSKVTDMYGMFIASSRLIAIYVGEGWVTENARTDNMFSQCGTDTVTLKTS